MQPPKMDTKIIIKCAEEDMERIPIFTVGQVVKTGNGSFTPDSQFLSTFLSSYRDFHAKYAYKPPILREHKEEGLNFGKIQDITVEGNTVIAHVEWAAGMMELRRRGLITEFSPAFHTMYEDPHDPDEKFPLLIRELSFVGVPNLKNLPKPPDNHFYTLNESEDSPAIITEPYTYTLTEQTDMDNKQQKMEEEQDLMKALASRLDKLEEAVSQLIDKDNDNEEEEMQEEDDDQGDGNKQEMQEEEADGGSKKEELSEDASHRSHTNIDTLVKKNVELQDRIHELEKSALKTELSERIEDLDEDTFEDLLSLKEVSPSLYEKTLITLSEASKPTSNATTGPKGKTGFPQKNTSGHTYDEVRELAEDKGLQGAERLEFFIEKGVVS